MKTLDFRSLKDAVEEDEKPSFGDGLDIELEDWQFLVRQVKTFCKDESPYILSPWQDVIFIVVRTEEDFITKNRIVLVPTDCKYAPATVPRVQSVKNVIAFGIVKGNSDDLQPDEQDIKLSIKLDQKIGRPIYYIIMNRKFEFDVYKSPMENVYGLLKPVEEAIE